MRVARIVAPLILAVVPSWGLGQAGPYLAVVSDADVRLRAGPSADFPETGTLPRGYPVRVERDEANTGWVAVYVPERSVSWVAGQFIEGFDPGRPLPQNVTVTVVGEAAITLSPGQVGVPQPLQVGRVKVPNGTILVAIGPPVKFENKMWYPVVPPHEDVRYVPKTAVRPAGSVAPAAAAFAVRGTDTATPNPLLTVAAPPPADAVRPIAATDGVGSLTSRPAGSNHPLWAQAERAEKDGKLDEAERLYFELARLMNEPGGDHDVANQCYTRVHTLRERKRLGLQSTGPNPPAAATGGWTPSARTDDRPPPPAAPFARTGTTPDRGRPPVDSRDADPADRTRWTGVGYLTRCPLAVDGRRTYALESSPGVVKYYVVSGGGVDLEKSVNRKVDVCGTVATRRDASRPVVTATAVEPGQ